MGIVGTEVTTVPNHAAQGEPKIDGTPEEGLHLVAYYSDVTDGNIVNLGTLTYQWFLVDGRVSSDIPGATAQTYAPKASDVGKTLKVSLVFSDRAGNREVRESDVSGTVSAAPTYLVSNLRQLLDTHINTAPGQQIAQSFTTGAVYTMLEKGAPPATESSSRYLQDSSRHVGCGT